MRNVQPYVHIDEAGAPDEARRIPQRALVLSLMSDGSWWTFARLQSAMAARGVHASEAGISARIRDLRKAEYGSHVIDKREVSNGLHEYRRVM